MGLVRRNPLPFVGLYAAAFAVCLAAAVVIGRSFLDYHPTLVSVGAGVSIVISLFGVPALVAIAVGEVFRSPRTRAAMGPMGRKLMLLAALYCLAFVAVLALVVAFDVAVLGYRPRMAAVAASVPLVGIAFAIPPLAVISGAAGRPAEDRRRPALGPSSHGEPVETPRVLVEDLPCYSLGHGQGQAIVLHPVPQQTSQRTSPHHRAEPQVVREARGVGPV